MKTWDYAAVCVLVVVGVLISVFVNRRDVDRALEMRPQIVVMDYRPVSDALAAGRAARDIEPLFKELKRRSDALRAAGFLVLNLSYVDAVPEGVALVMSPDEVQALLGTAAPVEVVRAPAASVVSPDEANAILRDFFGGKER